MSAVIAAIVLTLVAQQAPRDTVPVAPPRGTAVIRGRVLAADTKGPVPGATVTLAGSPGFPMRPQTFVTDASGRFELKDLPAGRYGLIPRPANYQMRFMAGARVEVTVAGGQIVEGVELALRRTGAIVGRIVDEHSQPIGGMSVSAAPLLSRPGTATGSAQMSDEHGRFRVFGLDPGAYYIFTRPSGFADPNVPNPVGFLETYYPGTPSRADATRLDVASGEDTDVGDLRVLRGRLLRVHGTVVDSQGRLAASNRTMVSLSCKGAYSMGRSVDAEGRFDFQPQPAGACWLIATMRTEGGQLLEEHVTQPLTLTDSDVEVLLTTKPAATVTGRLVLEEPAQLRAGTLSVRAQAPYVGSDFRAEPAPVAQDLTFTFPRIAGEQLLRVQGLAGSLTLKAVMRGNEDITDIPTEFKPNDSVRVVLGPRTSGLQGTVATSTGTPAASYPVLIFSEDRRTWVQGSTRVQAEIRTSREGHYAARVPPGRYYVVAVPIERSIAPYEIDPVALDALVKEATTVVVAPDEIRVVDLRVSGPDRH